MKFLNSNTVRKLKSGDTVWRCQIQKSGIPSIREIRLNGSRFRTRGKFRVTLIATVSKDHYSRNYMEDLIRVPCFATRRDALKFQREVNRPEYEGLRLHAIEHWKQCDDWFSVYESGYDSYDVFSV